MEMPLRAADLKHWREGQFGNLSIKIPKRRPIRPFIARALFSFTEALSFIGATHCCADTGARGKLDQSGGKARAKAGASP